MSATLKDQRDSLDGQEGEAREVLAPRAFDAGQVLTISAGHAMHDTYSAFLPPLLPELIRRFSMSNSQAGLLSAFLEIPSVIQPMIGYSADRVSLRYLVILVPALAALLLITAYQLIGGNGWQG